MNNPRSTGVKAVGEYWSRTLTSVLRGQWGVLDAGLQTVQTVLAPAAAAPNPESTSPRRTSGAAGRGLDELVNMALERTHKGLSPPKQIYEAPYRDRIDWSKFPDWARPSDPELFEGSCHEG